MRHATLFAAAPAALTLCALALTAGALRADEPPSGFSADELPYPLREVFTPPATATLSSGEVVVFDGVWVHLHPGKPALAPDHRRPSHPLTSFDSSVFPSFVVVAPDETFAIVGESTFGGIYRVDLAAGGRTLITTLTFNYDAVFEDADTLLVSAPGCCGDNEIHRVELATGTTLHVASAAGPSGPIALGTNGDLYYGTVSAMFPAPSGSTDVLRWDAALLTGAPVVTEADADVVSSGYDGAARLVRDPTTEELFLAENNFGSGINRIRRLDGPGPGSSPVLLEGTLGMSITWLEILPAAGPAVFRPYQPANGGQLLYTSADFFSTARRAEVRPLRPRAYLTGPGTQGPGPFTLHVEGGEPFAAVFVHYGPLGLFSEEEFPVSPGGAVVPLFTGLHLGTIKVDTSGAIGLDADGNGQKVYANPKGHQGVVAIQGVIQHQSSLIGTTEAAFL